MTIWSGVALGLLLLTLMPLGAAGNEVKRVLIVHSFGSTAPPFTTHSTAFATTLKQEMGKRVDLDEVSLDMARYAQPDMEAAFVQFLLRRLGRWQPDLVVPVGSPAGRFVNKYRDRLFPKIPVIYTGMDRRTLPPGEFENATFVGERFNLPGLVDDILEMAPDTTNLAVVIGASPLERFWTTQFRRAFEPFENRVRFTWFNDLPFEEMLERVAALPPNSFILLALLIRDASGVSHNQDEALQRLHAAANAPIQGLFLHQLGLGIVGGRLYQAEQQGIESARIAIRVLQGEPVSKFPPLIVPPQAPRYDWRELQRWNIPEDRLPAGSVIAFRQPPVFERYRWWIGATLAVGLAQACLILLLARNLVRRWRAERALRESEARVNLAADSAGAGLWSSDLATRRVWATPRLRELFQVSPVEELTVERLLGVVDPEDRERVRRVFALTGPGTPEPTLEFRIVRADGSERWIGTRGHYDEGPTSKGKRWSGASVDITESKVAEQRLRESESRFRTVADSAPVLIWMSGVDRACTFFNKPWLDFTGRTEEQELGSGWTEGVHPDDLPGCLKGYVQAFDTRQPFTLHYRLRRHDGDHRWISDHGVPRYDSHGNFTGYIGSCVDITERLNAEAETQQLRHELAHMSRLATMGELTAAIVHELGQPLAAIQLSAKAGLRSIATGESDLHDLSAILSDIADDEQRARRVIQHLRTMFQKGAVEHRPLQLNDVINEVASVVLQDAQRRKVAVLLDLASEPLWVSGNRIQLQQVVLNLVVNAFDALGEGGDRPRQVIIRTRALKGGLVQMDVADTGSGIPAESLTSIFKPFVTTKPRGMGMGLSVSQSIVNDHHGRLWAESHTDVGATFHVTLPAIAPVDGA